NLAINAGDAMARGGTLTIESTMVHLDVTHATHHPGVMAGAHVMLTVRDTGVGMDADTQARMFEPFFTTKAVGKGTGLGLSTVFGIVRQSGGRIWAESELGVGTAFYVCFPRTTRKRVATPAPGVGRAEQGTETILLVEDDEPVRTVTQSLLAREGYHVLPASNAEDAARLCESHAAPIHLLLTDIVMPGVSGWELAAKLRARRPEMKVLYMSGYADGAQFKAGEDAEPMPFLEKPITTETLSRKVHEALLHL
ncbi:MAG: response regulator, partial [Kofleriaceae bacterium]